MLRWTAVWVLVLACFSTAPAQIAFLREDRVLVDRTLHLPATTNEKRLNLLRSLYVRIGIPPTSLRTQPVPASDWPNLVCTIKGDDDQVIVIGAPYTSANNDANHWPEAAMLPLAAEAIASAHRHHTFVLVAFGGDDEHSKGAQSFIEAMPKSGRAAIKTMVNLERLGMGSPTVWFVERKTPLQKYMQAAADGFHVPIEVSTDRAPVGDARPFSREDIPALTVQSLARKPKGISRDGMAAATLNHDWYYDTYTLLSAFLVIVDQSLGVTSASNKGSDHSLDRIPSRPPRTLK